MFPFRLICNPKNCIYESFSIRIEQAIKVLAPKLQKKPVLFYGRFKLLQDILLCELQMIKLSVASPCFPCYDEKTGEGISCLS